MGQRFSQCGVFAAAAAVICSRSQQFSICHAAEVRESFWLPLLRPPCMPTCSLSAEGAGSRQAQNAVRRDICRAFRSSRDSYDVTTAHRDASVFARRAICVPSRPQRSRRHVSPRSLAAAQTAQRVASRPSVVCGRGRRCPAGAASAHKPPVACRRMPSDFAQPPMVARRRCRLPQQNIECAQCCLQQRSFVVSCSYVRYNRPACRRQSFSDTRPQGGDVLHQPLCFRRRTKCSGCHTVRNAAATLASANEAHAMPRRPPAVYQALGNACSPGGENHHAAERQRAAGARSLFVTAHDALRRYAQSTNRKPAAAMPSRYYFERRLLCPRRMPSAARHGGYRQPHAY